MNGPLLRLLDANANRAREALRVLEDYSRFVLNDKEMSAELKDLRHALTGTIGPYLPNAILHRDTPGDVGTSNKTEAEQNREDLAHIVTAAGKRLGEALRSIEEYLKTVAPEDSAQVELLRYAFYDTEQRLARTLRPAEHFAKVRLYVLITEKLCRGPWLETAEQALQGGADCLQLREKEMDGGELLCRAKHLVALCRKYGALCILNDRPDIAVLADTDGVHVGQEDLPAAEVRKLVGREKIVGVSTHCLEQARRAVRDGADYIGVGPFFRSSTKPRDILPGPEYARQAAEAIPIPAVAIAGITAENVDEVLACGIGAVAVSSAIIAAADVRKAAEEMKGKLVEQTFLSVPPPSQADLKIKRRHMPHWRLAGSVYFITFRAVARDLGPEDRAIVLNHIRSGDGKYYTLFAAVIMPDHVHVLLRPKGVYDLSRITKGMKGACTRLLNLHWRSSGIVWQNESWDRIMRDQAEFDEKLAYMLNNAVKRELVDDPWEYDGWYLNPTPQE
jgi:thiamine-phosphate pyrophosphorylase